MIYQSEISRIILIYVFLGILSIFFSIITYKVLKRKRHRLNMMISRFYISLMSAFIINMIYAAMTNRIAILILNFLTNYFIFFGPVFLLIMNLIILESSILYSLKKQNMYIIYYGSLLFTGMIFLVLLGEIFDTPGVPFLGVQIINNAPKWGIYFFIYVVSVMSIFTLIPVNYTNFKIYFKFKFKTLKKKWLYHLLGFLGLTITFYLSCLSNLMNPDNLFRSIIMLLNILVVLWGYMMHHGIGSGVKD